MKPETRRVYGKVLNGDMQPRYVAVILRDQTSQCLRVVGCLLETNVAGFAVCGTIEVELLEQKESDV